MFKSSRKEVKYHGNEFRTETIVEFMVYTGKQELQELLRVVQWMRDFHLPKVAQERGATYEGVLAETVQWTSEEREAALSYEKSKFKIFKKKPHFYDDVLEHELQERLTREVYDEALYDLQVYRLIQRELLTAEKMLQHLFYYEDKNHNLQRAIRLYREHS